MRVNVNGECEKDEWLQCECNFKTYKSGNIYKDRESNAAFTILGKSD